MRQRNHTAVDSFAVLVLNIVYDLHMLLMHIVDLKSSPTWVDGIGSNQG